MSRGNQILAGILVVQIVLGVLVFWPRTAPVIEGELLFGEIDVEQVDRVTIRQGGDELVLAKELGAWVLPEAGNYPCNEGAVPDLLKKVVALTADRLVTETKSSHERLKVSAGAYESAVEFELSDGTRHVLYIGSTPNYGAAHVRAEGQNQVYLVSGISGMEATARVGNWVDTQYVSLAQDEIFAITLESATDRLTFTKDNTGTWTMPELGVDEALKETAVASLASGISSLRMVRPLGTEDQEHYALGTPSAVLTVHTRDEVGTTEKHTLLVGATLIEEKGHFCKWSGSPYYALVAEYSTREWIDATRESFLELPPTPEPPSVPSSP